MQPSDEIMALEPRQNQPYQESHQFLWGFSEAKETAHWVAFRHEMRAQHLAEVLQSIDLEDQTIARALGEDTALEIQLALQMYRDHIDNK